MPKHRPRRPFSVIQEIIEVIEGIFLLDAYGVKLNSSIGRRRTVTEISNPILPPP